MKEIIEEHLTKNKLGEAIEILLHITKNGQPRLHQTAIIQSARYHGNESDNNMGVLDPANYNREKRMITLAVSSIAKDLDPNLRPTDFPDLPAHLLNPQTPSITTSKKKKSVFISYSHADKDVANRLHQEFEKHDLKVIIDKNALHPGYDITEFIKKAVKESDFTVTIISKNSLLSTWVTLETLRTFIHEEAEELRRFLPCFIDESFHDPMFHIDAIDQIDAEIKKLDEAIRKLQERQVDTADFNAKRTQWYDIRSNLNKILKRIQNTMAVDLTSDQFEGGVKELVDRISSSSD